MLAPALPERFQIIRQRGAGGMGVVFEVHDVVRGHRVALKTLKHAGADDIYRLKREFRTLADTAHPNLVELYDLFVEGGRCFYTMELVEGVDFLAYCRHQDPSAPPLTGSLGPLANTVRDHPSSDATPEEEWMAAADTHPALPSADELGADGTFDEARLRRALPQLIEAIATLHQLGLVHRDIKPSNVLVTEAGRVVLLDFGLVADLDAHLPRSTLGRLVGTLAYMSPEQAQQHAELTPATDWYALGAILYEVLTGRPPNGGNLGQVLVAKQRPCPPPSALVSGLPADLDDLCEALLAVDPEERPRVDEIKRRLGLVTGPALARVPEASFTGAFTGRADEREALNRSLARAASPRTAAVYVRGESGIGKSSLVGQFLHDARTRQRDTVILEGRCYEHELVRFKAFDAVIDGLSRYWRSLSDEDAGAILPRGAAYMPLLFPVLGRVAAIAAAPAANLTLDPVEVRMRAIRALRETLHRIGDRHPLVIALDDLQWVDDDTLSLLEDLLSPPDAPALLLVLSSRLETSVDLADLARRLDDEATVLELGPLSQEEAATLARRMLSADDAGRVARVVSEAGGNPLFLGELIRYSQSLPPEATDAIQLDRVVEGRIQQVPPAARILLELLAVAGEPVHRAVLAATGKVERQELTHLLRQLRAHQLVRETGASGEERVEVYHDRIREVLVSLLGEADRRELHRTLALALEASGDAPRLARHWAGAGDRDRAAEYARQGGDHALGTFDFEQAVALYGTALELGRFEGETRRTLLGKYGTALLNTGRNGEAAEMFLQAVEGSDIAHQLELQRRAAEAYLSGGAIDEGLAVVRAVLASLGEELPATPRRALASLAWNRLVLRVRGLGWRTRDADDVAPRALLRRDLYIAISIGLGLVDPLVGSLFQNRGLRLSLRLGERRRIGHALALEAVYRASAGDANTAVAERILAEVHRIAADTGDPYLRAWESAGRGIVCYFTGRYHPGIEELTQAEELFREHAEGAHWEVKNSRIFALQCLRFVGGFDRIRRQLPSFLRDARQRGDRYVETMLFRAINAVALADDDVDRARRHLAESRWVPPQGRYHLQHWYDLRATGEIALYAGEAAQVWEQRQPDFGRLQSSLLTRVQITRAEAQWLAGKLALAAGDPRAATRALRRLRRERTRFARVWSALLDAGLTQLRGDLDGAAAAWSAARRLAEEAGMHLCAAAATRRLGELLGGDEGAALREEADEIMRHNGIVNPAAMTPVAAPLGPTGARARSAASG